MGPQPALAAPPALWGGTARITDLAVWNRRSHESPIFTPIFPWAYLSCDTIRWLKGWLANAKISEGASFRRLVGGDKIGGAINPGSIAPIFKRVAEWIGLPARNVEQVSGHSTGVGATQEFAALNIDLAAITQAGGWKSTRMPVQYAEKISASRSGIVNGSEI
jgi:hypothetical protein